MQPCKLLVDEELNDDDEQLGQYGLKKLNLNIPLLSVRRRLLLVARPAADHDESSRGHFSRHDDNRNNHESKEAAADHTISRRSNEEGQQDQQGVPFSWEQSPGKPKLLLKLKLKVGSISSINNINHIEEQQLTNIIINRPCKPPPGWANNWQRCHHHHQLDDQNKYHVMVSPRDTYSTSDDGDCDVGLINDGSGAILTSNINAVLDDNHVDDQERSDHRDHSRRLSQALSAEDDDDDDAVVDVASLSEAIDILERARARERAHHHHQLMAHDDQLLSADHQISSSSPSFLINRFLPDANALAEEYYSSFCAHHQNQLIISRSSSSSCSDDDFNIKLANHETCRNTCSSSSINNTRVLEVDNVCQSCSGPPPPPVQLASRITSTSCKSNTTAATSNIKGSAGSGCGLDNIFSSWRTKRRSMLICGVKSSPVQPSHPVKDRQQSKLSTTTTIT